jgi:DNA-directed RNA polymerase subunit F
LFVALHYNTEFNGSLKRKKQQVWYVDSNVFELSDNSKIHDTLPNGIYTIHKGMFGFYLVREQEEFVFDYKLYGLEEKLIKRVLKAYEQKGHGNLGVLLNGLKGTGKSVTAKIISNKLNQPVILIAKELKEIKDCHLFINSIPQNVTVFIDEYEKIFGQSSDMLTIMDGALNSPYRRVFLMTTNELYVDKNLIERPSRVRYLKKFSDLQPQVVEEIVDDILEHKQFRSQCIRFISSLETITVDIVKAVLEEVNLHCEAPDDFSDVFNVKKITGKFNIQIEDANGEYVTLTKKAKINYKPSYQEGHIGNMFAINDEYIGTIGEIYGYNTLLIEPLELDEDDEDSSEPKTDNRLIKEPIVIRIEEAESFHSTYAYGYGKPMNANRKPVSSSNTVASLSQALGGKKSASYMYEDGDED